MRIIVLGGDGFCGWPTSMRLSNIGHEVLIIDNLVRRKIDVELEVTSLTPIASMSARLLAWRSATGKTIRHIDLDIARDYDRLSKSICEFEPEVIVHFAEQRAAPYSMKSERHKRYTVDNNVGATHNLLCAVVESGLDIHIVHLGTMGVYGYGGGARIPEGYLPVEMVSANGGLINKEILFPADPGSIYHMTKTLDQLLFYYYNKNDRIRITDLHQGIVWGTNIPECELAPELINRFDYDGDYGTVLNRFLMQAAVGYPLTVHGAGGQTRAFIHVRDSVRCIELAIANPPTKDARVQIFNQMTETHRVRDLAEIVVKIAGGTINFVPNPRLEAHENDLAVEAQSLIGLGLEPTYLAGGLLEEVMNVAKRYAARCDLKNIPSTSTWRKDMVLGGRV